MVTDYLLAKISSMLGGFFGGAAILSFIVPKTVGEAFMRGAISTGSAIVFSSPILTWLHMPATWDNEMMAGFAIGFLAYSVLGMVANLLIKYQNKDIVEAIKDIKK